MNSLADFFSSWSEPLVWTLLHSLWQALIIMGVLIILLRIVPSRHSSVRYVMTTSALALLLVCSVTTYANLSSGVSVVSNLSSEFLLVSQQAYESTTQTVASPLNGLRYLIESNIYVIALAWMAGAFLFSLRMASGFLYISTIRKSAIPLSEEWTARLHRLASQINVKPIVALAESAHIQVPLVIGYFKPLILIPAGMISGLSTEQLESILVHELMHIRRNDYLVNILQAIVEALFFFNPFVWFISSIIRREREHCCDDEAVKHGNALAYAHALAQLEELRLTNTSIVLSLAENKNQLLKRIKRIMEKSVQNYSVKERIVPILLLVAGLICASWLTIKSPGSEQSESEEYAAIAGDTTKPKEKSATYSRKSITTRDKDGKPNVGIVESFDGDEELKPMMEDFDWDEHFALDPLVPLSPLDPIFALDPLVPISPIDPPLSLDAIAALPIEPFDFPVDWSFTGDTIPEIFFKHHDWDAFSEEFEAKFREKFSDFYKKHQEELQKMMQEMGKEYKMKFGDEWAERMQEEVQRHQELAMQQMELNKQNFEFQQRAMEQAQKQAEQSVVDQKVYVKRLERQAKAMEDKMKTFEKELTSELIKDGYLGKDEKIKTMNWNDPGDIEINGKKIKATDKKKYLDLHRKFFKERETIWHVE